ncbi:MAG: hypothetical protein AAFZ80_02465 [Cyanobacteria bacterium P01_A01_bin.105]
MIVQSTASQMLTGRAACRASSPGSQQPSASPLSLPADLSLAQPPGETVRHILLGTPSVLHQTIHLLHSLRYVETSQWTPLVDIPLGQLIVTPAQGEQMSMLVRRL